MLELHSSLMTKASVWAKMHTLYNNNVRRRVVRFNGGMRGLEGEEWAAIDGCDGHEGQPRTAATKTLGNTTDGDQGRLRRGCGSSQ